MLKFKGTCQFMELNDGSAIIGSEQHSLRLSNLNSIDREIISELSTGVTSDSPILSYTLTKNLIKEGFVAELDSHYQEEHRLSRQIDYLSSISETPFSTQSQFIDKKIMIIGCGGTGSMIAQALLGHGFHKFVLIDNDTVQASNFNRQIFFSYDSINKPKVDALASSIRRLQPEAKVDKEQLKIDSQDTAKSIIDQYSPDFVVNGADLPPILIQKWLVGATVDSDLPIVFGGIGANKASLGPLLCTKSAKAKYLNWLERQLKILKADTLKPIKGSLASTNLMGSSLIASDIFRFFADRENCQSLNARIIFDLVNLKISKKENFNE